MPEPRFGARPPSVIIIGGLSFAANAGSAFRGDVPPWEVLAGESWLRNPNQLRFTHQLPAVTFTIAGTVEAEGNPPLQSSTYTLRLFAEGPFKPDRGAQFGFAWPAGESSIQVEGSLSVPSGYNEWRWAQFSAFSTDYRDFEWTVIG